MWAHGFILSLKADRMIWHVLPILHCVWEHLFEGYSQRLVFILQCERLGSSTRADEVSGKALLCRMSVRLTQ